jgi:hypothetical protein
VLPTVFPLALGETPVLQALSTPFPTTGNHSSAARVWYKAMQHLAAHNGGFSLHDHPGLFAASDLPATLFPTSILVASSGVAVTTVDAMSPHFGHVQTVHREAGHGALLSHTAGLRCEFWALLCSWQSQNNSRGRTQNKTNHVQRCPPRLQHCDG